MSSEALTPTLIASFDRCSASLPPPGGAAASASLQADGEEEHAAGLGWRGREGWNMCLHPCVSKSPATACCNSHN